MYINTPSRVLQQTCNLRKFKVVLNTNTELQSVTDITYRIYFDQLFAKYGNSVRSREMCQTQTLAYQSIGIKVSNKVIFDHTLTPKRGWRKESNNIYMYYMQLFY